MGRFVEGSDRRQSWLLPNSLDDYVTDDNPVRVVGAFIDEFNLGSLEFARAAPAATGRPAYDPVTLLKLYLYGYLNRVPSSRRLEREAQRNIEVMCSRVTLPPITRRSPTSGATTGLRSRRPVGSSWCCAGI
jgi:transposase